MPPRVELQRAYRRLIGGLAFWQLAHLFGLLTMGLVLLPGLNPALPLAERAAYVREHAWLWRLGWLPWQLCAVSDAWVALALWRWTAALGEQARIARRWAVIGIVWLVIAIVPEQYAEARLVSDFVAASAAPQWGEQLGLYMWLTGTWADAGYTLMTACWLLAMHAARRALGVQGPRSGWSRAGELSMLIAFGLAGVANHFAWRWREGTENAQAFALSSLFNGYAFPALAVAGAAIAHWLGRVQLRAVGADGRDPFAPTWPVAASRAGRFAAMILGSAGVRDLVRAVQRWTFFPRLRSDIRDVLYLNWLVDADALAAVLAPGVRAQRLGRHSLLSLLVYRHGHFGPALLGPLRRLMPSPIQCNLRVYLDAMPNCVAFLNNSIDAALYFAGTRLLSDGLPAHLCASAQLARDGARLAFSIDPGAGSALALHVVAEETTERSIPATFAECFGDWSAAVAVIVPQNAAVRVLPTTGQQCCSDIVVDAPLDQVRPARLLSPVSLGAPFAELVADSPALAFIIPAVRFSVLGETWTLAPPPT